MGTAIPYVLAAISAYGAYESTQSSKESARKQEMAVREQQRRSDIEAYRQRIQQVREARMARGATLQTAQAMGVGASSSAAGAVSSIGSQMGANISFLDTMQQSAQQQSIFQTQAIAAQTRAQEYGTYGQIAGSIFSQGYGGWGELLRQKPKTPSIT